MANKNLPMTDEVFNQIWNAGLNSGLKLADEIHEGLIASEFEIKNRADQLLNEDADGIEALWKLKKEMGK